MISYGKKDERPYLQNFKSVVGYWAGAPAACDFFSAVVSCGGGTEEDNCGCNSASLLFMANLDTIVRALTRDDGK